MARYMKPIVKKPKPPKAGLPRAPRGGSRTSGQAFGWQSQWQKQPTTPATGGATAWQNTPAAPKPAPPKPPPLPQDSIYHLDVGQAQRTRDSTLTALGHERTQLDQSFGFNDLSNPYSQAAALQRSYQQGQRAKLNSAGNNLYSSSLQRNLDEGTHRYNRSYDSLRRTYDAASQSLTDQERATRDSYENAEDTAQGGAIERAIAKPTPDPNPKAGQSNFTQGVPTSVYVPQGAKGVGGGWWKNTTGNKRKGQRFKVRYGPDGAIYHVYENGKKVKVS